MKPFSPIYFIKENRKRCVLFMLMIFLGFGAYLGGLYVTNPYDNFKLHFKYCDGSVFVGGSDTDKDFSDYRAFRDKAAADKNISVIEFGSYNAIAWKTVMGFTSGGGSYICHTFKNVGDFKTFCEYHDIDCDFDSIKSGSVVMSSRMAKNQGLKKGQKIGKDEYASVYRDFTLDALTGEEGYTQYYITDESDASNFLLILGHGMSGGELYNYVYELAADCDVLIGEPLRDEIESQFEFFNIIYFVILAFFSIIMAVVVNSAFVSMYQRRENEFAVYIAIGIPKKRIVGKIAGELLCMDVIALAVGGAVFFAALYLFNSFALHPKGLYLNYFEPAALFGLALCNLMTVVPLIITRSRSLLRADICDF